MPPYLKEKISDAAVYGTYKDVAQTRRISKSQQHRLIDQGKIIARKMGMRTLIYLPSVDDYLASLPDAAAEEHKTVAKAAEARS